jgi:hypothetical protein
MKILEHKQFGISFMTPFDVSVKQEQMYLMNLSKLNAFLWDQCSEAMQHKIEACQAFED